MEYNGDGLLEQRDESVFKRKKIELNALIHAVHVEYPEK